MATPSYHAAARSSRAALDAFALDVTGFARGRRRRIDRRLHGLPAAARRGARGRDRRRARAARVVVANGSPGHGDGADQRPRPAGRCGGSARRGLRGRPVVHLAAHGRSEPARAHHAGRRVRVAREAAVRSGAGPARQGRHRARSGGARRGAPRSRRRARRARARRRRGSPCHRCEAPTAMSSSSCTHTARAPLSSPPRSPASSADAHGAPAGGDPEARTTPRSRTGDRGPEVGAQ